MLTVHITITPERGDYVVHILDDQRAEQCTFLCEDVQSCAMLVNLFKQPWSIRAFVNNLEETTIPYNDLCKALSDLNISISDVYAHYRPYSPDLPIKDNYGCQPC